MDNSFDLVVIGAGPGGYVSAIKASKLGMRVAVVEKEEVGGTCLNRGCIPAKSLLHSAELYRQILNCQRFGISAENISFDIDKIHLYKNDVVNKLRGGIEQLLKANRVTLVKGKGTIEKGQIVKVEDGGSTVELHSKNILISTGSKPAMLPVKGIDLPNVITSDDLLASDGKIYKKLAIVGGGVIGVEFATIFNSLGSEVTIIEAMPTILPGMDREISQNLKMILKRRGVEVYTDASVEEISEENGLTCHFKLRDQRQCTSADAVLIAIGRVPNTKDLFGEGIELEMEKGRIIVDESFRTSLENIYAIGDVIKGMQLADLASAQGIFTVEKLNSMEPSIDLSIVPACVYTEPEIASVGITADEAKEREIPVRIGKFITSANGKSMISMEERGFIKVVIDESTDIIIGAQMMCARATDMIGEMAAAITNKLTSKQLLRSMKAHPTFNESITEAIEDCYDGAIHAVPKKGR
jgi:dihydrolipoamide dehydrogenase